MPKKRIAMLLVFGILLFGIAPIQAAEISESEVQAAVDTQGKEAVAGNLLIWFLCATAFLKISQRMDSFLNMLGVNVGHTGGGAFSDAVVAIKSLTGMARLANGSGSSYASTAGKSAYASGFAGGLAGMVARQAVSKTAAQATGEASGGMLSGIGSKLYDNTLGKPNGFAQSVISNIATTDGGMMTGDKAAEAFQAYVGSNQTSADNGMAIETAPQYESVSTDPYAEAAASSNISPEEAFMSSAHEQAISPDSMMAASAYSPERWSAAQSAVELEVPEVSAADVFGISPSPAAGYPSSGDLASETPADGLSVGEGALSTDFASIPNESAVAGSSVMSPANENISLAAGSTWSDAADTPSAGSLEQSVLTASSSEGANIDTGAILAAQSAATATSVGSSGTAGMAASAAATSPNTATVVPAACQYRDIEIGRGQIRGIEVSNRHPDGISFAMYHADKYLRPEDGTYVTVQTADGASWYKQYAQPTVKRTPIAEVRGKVEQKEQIVYKLPQAPQQKAKI